MTKDSPRPSLQDASTSNPHTLLDSEVDSDDDHPPSMTGISDRPVDILINAPQWQEDLSIDFQSLIEKCLSVILQEVVQSKAPFDLSVLLTNDDEIQKLNKNYRQKDQPTNVLSFESGAPIQTLAAQYKAAEAGEGTSVTRPIPLGDIALSYETLVRESQEQQKSFQDHFTHLIIHGILHLLGFDHELDFEAETMEALEIKLLKTYFNINNPYHTQD